MILPRGIEILEPENWAPVTELIVPNIVPIYTISTYGRIYNARTNTYLPQNIFYRKNKYITVSLALNDGSHVFKQIHRLELEVFNPIDSSNNYDANHKDGVKYHNWIWNLEWATHKENMNHAWDNNLFKFGSERANTVYDEQLIHTICQMIANGLSYKQVEKSLGFECEKLYHNIKNGHCWTHISQHYDFSNAFKRSVFTDEQKDIIIKMKIENPNINPIDIVLALGYEKGPKSFYDKVAAAKRVLVKHKLL